MLHFMTHSNWLPGYPDIWPKTASGQICTGGSGWHYAGTRNLREAGFSLTLGKTHPVCWKSRSNASLVRNNNPLDLTNVFKRAHPLSWLYIRTRQSPQDQLSWVSGSPALSHQPVSDSLPPPTFLLSLHLTLLSLSCPIHTHTPAMFLHKILKHTIP